jgi:hypothetical protein
MKYRPVHHCFTNPVIPRPPIGPSTGALPPQGGGRAPAGPPWDSGRRPGVARSPPWKLTSQDRGDGPCAWGETPCAGPPRERTSRRDRLGGGPLVPGHVERATTPDGEFGWGGTSVKA